MLQLCPSQQKLYDINQPIVLTSIILPVYSILVFLFSLFLPGFLNSYIPLPSLWDFECKPHVFNFGKSDLNNSQKRLVLFVVVYDSEVLLYNYETWSLTSREELWLRVCLKTRSWSEYLNPRGMRTGSGGSSTMRNFIVCTVHLI